jgi:hypothetical protein
MKPLIAFVVLLSVATAAQTQVAFKPGNDKLDITLHNATIATYVFRDAKTPRPYFMHLKVNGVQVTRNHPPVPGKDATDHGELHPGLWLAFGDLAGADSWRLKASVKHDKFTDEPSAKDDKGTFAVRNFYLANDGKTVLCQESCRYTVIKRPSGFLLLWDSEFQSPAADFTFGDQEEMGLGVRLATALTVKAGGQILSSEGHKNEKEVRGKSTLWADYSGTIDGKRAGVTLMQHKSNSKMAWYHARDYGLLVLNPFGRKALAGGETLRVAIPKGGSFRMRYGILVHATTPPAELDLEGEYRTFLKLVAN